MNQRVGTAQRTQVLELLSHALEQGYLDLAEFEQRSHAVTSAKTADVLMGLVADLPPQLQWDPRMVPIPNARTSAGNPNAHTTSVAALVLSIISIPLSVCYGIGGLFGIAAVLLSRPGLRSASDHGKALTGLVLGCLGIVSSIVFIVLFVFLPPAPTGQ